MRILIALIIFFAGSLSAFAFAGRSQDSAVGHIKFYGNAPFAFAGFETKEGRLYKIEVEEGSDFSIKDIENEVGSLLELTGEIDSSRKNDFNVLKDGVFIVSEWKKL